MRPATPAFLILLTAATPVLAGSITVIGDSLTKEFEITFPGVPGVVAGFDAANPGARTWCETLHSRRVDHFSLGTFRNSIFNPWSDLRLLGHEYNWAVPGISSRTIRNVFLDPNTTEITADADFALVSAYAPLWKQTGTLMGTQVATTSSAVVIWCGANDLRYGNTDPQASFGGTKITYETIWEGDGTGAGDPAGLMNSIRTSVQEIAGFVRSKNATIPIVVCSVPHIGCTPTVKGFWPNDAVRTGRITTALDALNADLQSWTENTFGGIWVDTYSVTKHLLTGTFEMGGIIFTNAKDNQTAAAPAAAHNRFIFSHDGFHPTSTIPAVFARSVQRVLRERHPATFGSSLELTEREILVDVLGFTVTTGYDDFMTASGVLAGQRAPGGDPDGDGMANIMEFALDGNDPAGAIPPSLPFAGFEGGPTPVCTLTWAPRFATNIYAAIKCQSSTDLNAWTDVPESQISEGVEGSRVARVPHSGPAPLFLRLKVTATP